MRASHPRQETLTVEAGNARSDRYPSGAMTYRWTKPSHRQSPVTQMFSSQASVNHFDRAQQE